MDSLTEKTGMPLGRERHYLYQGKLKRSGRRPLKYGETQDQNGSLTEN